MTYGSRYRVPLRRRREQKTDYQARKAFVVSRKPRIVARSSLKNTIVQIIVAKPNGDDVLASAHSRELIKKYGWKAATGNVPAAYLTGLLCGLKAKQKDVAEAILDLGLVSPIKGSKPFSAMSGVVDAGIEVPHDPEKIVKERTQGYHIQDYAENLGASEEYAPKFSTYKANGLAPEKFNDHFVEVRNSILTAFGMPIPKPEPRPVKAKKPEPKKVEAKPVKAEKPAPKPEAAPASAKAVEAKAPEVKPKPEAEAKPKAPVEAKPKAEPEAEPEEEEPKPKAKAKAKPEAKKAPAKAKAEKAPKEEAEEAKPKRARKKPDTKEASAKPAKKAGGKKA
jgi:large subunit ribosomal protein L18